MKKLLVMLVSSVYIAAMDTEQKLPSSEAMIAALQRPDNLTRFFNIETYSTFEPSNLSDTEQLFFEKSITSLPNIVGQFSDTEKISCIVKDPCGAYMLIGFNSGKIALHGLGMHAKVKKNWKASLEVVNVPVTALAPVPGAYNVHNHKFSSIRFIAGFKNGDAALYDCDKKGHKWSGSKFAKSPITCIASTLISDVFLLSTANKCFICKNISDKQEFWTKTLYRAQDSSRAIVGIGHDGCDVIVKRADGSICLISPYSCAENEQLFVQKSAQALTQLYMAREQKRKQEMDKVQHAISTLAPSANNEDEDEK